MVLLPSILHVNLIEFGANLTLSPVVSPCAALVVNVIVVPEQSASLIVPVKFPVP